jgi:hypothetical protein
MRTALLVVALSITFTPACDGGEKKSIADQISPATKNVADVKAESKVSEEELKRRRKEAGFVSKEEADAKLAAENAALFEKGDREYVKARLADYRKLTVDTRKLIDDIEKDATKWAAAKDPAKAFEKQSEELHKRYKEVHKKIDELSEKGTKGGNTMVILNKVYRPLEELDGALGPDLSKDPALPETFKNMRAALDEADKAFTDIEKDETLIVSKFAKTGEDAEGADKAKNDKKK